MKNNHFVFFLIILLSFFIMTACSDTQTTDFSQNEDYKQFFSDTDEALHIDLKNIVLSNIQAFNEGDAKAYCSLFAMIKDDSQYNEASFRDLRRIYHISYTVKNIHVAAVSNDNAQVLLNVLYQCESIETGEKVYLSENELTYTMQRRGGKWQVIEYKDQELADLTNLDEDVS